MTCNKRESFQVNNSLKDLKHHEEFISKILRLFRGYYVG